MFRTDNAEWPRYRGDHLRHRMASTDQVGGTGRSKKDYDFATEAQVSPQEYRLLYPSCHALLDEGTMHYLLLSRGWTLEGGGGDEKDGDCGEKKREGP